MVYLHFIGIDVSKEWFDAVEHVPAAKPERFKSDGAGFAAFARRFAVQLPQALVVLESTGGYESALIAFLLTQKVAVHRAHPLTAKHFLRSIRLHAKTDALDAKSLARYASERHANLALCRPQPEKQAQMEALLARRSDLVAMRVAEQNRLKHPRYAGLKESIQAVLDALNQQIIILETALDVLVQSCVELTQKLHTLTSVKGVGKQTAYTILATMPEIGTLTRRQVASLAGCAPHPKESGKIARYRSTAGGRQTLKRALFMAAMAARNFHPELKTFYEQLIQNGKKPMVALTAVMRKLIVILNAKIRDQFYAIT